MLLIDTGAIADLKRKMAPEIQPMAQAPIQAPLLAPAPPSQMPLLDQPDPIRSAPMAPKPSLWGKIASVGRPELPPEVASLLTPEQQKRATSGGLLERVGLQLLGGGMFTPAMQARWKADRILNDQATKEQVTDAATLKEQMAALRKKHAGGDFRQFAAELAMLRPELAGPLSGMVNAMEVPEPKAQSAIPNMSWVPDGRGGYRQLGTAPAKTEYRTFDGKLQMSDDGGKTWTVLGDAGSGGSGSEPLVAIEGPDGSPVLVPRSQAVRQKPYSAGVGSAINQASKARLSAAIGEMNNAHDGMAEFEKGLANGTIKISAAAQLLQRLANSFTHDDPVSQFTQSAALATLNRTDPALARYIRRGLSFAEGESMISQRPSDFRTKMAAFLSTAASGASPELVSDIAGRRNAILDPLNNTVGRKVKADAGLKKLSASDLAKAKTDPEFAAWAKSNGYEVP